MCVYVYGCTWDCVARASVPIRVSDCICVMRMFVRARVCVCVCVREGDVNYNWRMSRHTRTCTHTHTPPYSMLFAIKAVWEAIDAEVL